jgi:hypothetical protein
MSKAASNTAPTIKIKVVTIAQFSSVGPYSSYRYERRRALRRLTYTNGSIDNTLIETPYNP